MYIFLTLIVIGICLIFIKILVNDMALRLTSIIYNYDCDELKELKHRRRNRKCKD